jgi:hypothetical protein
MWMPFLSFMLPQVEMVVVRLLGGRASFAYGMDRLVAWAKKEMKIQAPHLTFPPRALRPSDEHAVIVDHLVPPMTSAGAYGALAELAQMVDEYYRVEALDPGKLPESQRQIWHKIIEANLDADLKAMVRQDHGDHTRVG